MLGNALSRLNKILEEPDYSKKHHVIINVVFCVLFYAFLIGLFVKFPQLLGVLLFLGFFLGMVWVFATEADGFYEEFNSQDPRFGCSTSKKSKM